MSAKITGPYGTFSSIAEATRVIAHTRAPEFIKQYSNYDFPYDPSKMDKNFQGDGCSTKQYIYRAIHDMVGSATSGRRKPHSNWKRI